MRSELKDGWANVSKTDKTKVFQQNREILGPGLKAALTQTIEHTFRQKRETSFAADGDWLDEDDVKEMFKNKPEQFKHVLANAKTMTCPVRGITLYEVLKYKSHSSDHKEMANGRRLEVSTATSHKGSKRAIEGASSSTDKSVKGQ